MRKDSVLSISAHYLKQTLISTVSLVVFLFVLGLPVVVFSSGVPEFFSYVVLGIVGWSIYFGQELAVWRMHTPPEERENTSDEGLLTKLSYLLYFNAVLFTTIVFANTAYIAGSGPGALIIALLYPIYETETAYHSLPISLGGLASFTLLVTSRLLKGLGKTTNEIDWEALKLDQSLLNIFQTLIDDLRPRPR
ncbi:hypothetical protein EGH24_09875 [Halonotius terrestris]|uniref:Uncharacterized protein n=1 Tax=Halonotius terrestris TaxID=2487750 RepID=A0A8J8PAS2_9EURY|nr:hypothetical protein [Halonotius terrestris]TQQ79795.1 hypothetical protein EGH24_09875 [Halonotius terrestris]